MLKSQQDSMKFSDFASNVAQRYLHPGEDWLRLSQRVTDSVFGAVFKKMMIGGPSGRKMQEHAVDSANFFYYLHSRRILPGGRYLYAAGRKFHQTQNCVTTKALDTREGWGFHASRVTQGLMSGAGFGCDYSDLRAEGTPLEASGGFAGGPLSLMHAINALARPIRQGGARRAALYASLHWAHKDIFKFISAKHWSPEIRALKAKNFEHPADLDHTNISVRYDESFFDACNSEMPQERKAATAVFSANVASACQFGDPGFQFDWDDQIGRNACTEFISDDDNDVCNLASLNLARFSTLEEFKAAIRPAVRFLLAGTFYSDLPYPEIEPVRAKNRRIGLGLMGMHEWLLVRGYRYEMVPELANWLSVYEEESDKQAKLAAFDYGCPVPKAVRAIAPTGTIGIVAETTTGIEPIFAVAYERRYFTPEGSKVEVVIDPTAKRLIEAGANPDQIEDALTLSGDVERRLKFQAQVQNFVDMGISSTINLPAWGSPGNNENNLKEKEDVLLRYLPSLRGVTLYPDGAHAGQPITRLDYREAIERLAVPGTVDVCDLRGGSCGS